MRYMKQNKMRISLHRPRLNERTIRYQFVLDFMRESLYFYMRSIFSIINCHTTRYLKYKKNTVK